MFSDFYNIYCIQNCKNLNIIWLTSTVSTVTETDMIRRSGERNIIISVNNPVHKSGLSLNIVFKTDLKQKSDITFYYKAGINKGSIFFSVIFGSCYFAYCMFVFLGRRKRMAASFLAVEIKKSMMCEKNNQWLCWGIDKEISGSFSDYLSHARQSLAWD